MNQNGSQKYLQFDVKFETKEKLQNLQGPEVISDYDNNNEY